MPEVSADLISLTRSEDFITYCRKFLNFTNFKSDLFPILLLQDNQTHNFKNWLYKTFSQLLFRCEEAISTAMLWSHFCPLLLDTLHS